MVIEHPIDLQIAETIVPLNGRYEDELFAFMQRFYPSFFKHKTILLGEYFGIFKENELVAVTGERMQMEGYTEVSAVVTHTDHFGKGYAKQLVTHTTNNIFRKNKIPFLHTNADSVKNIGLYEKLGFKVRREISLWRFAPF
jgi:predicted GNAT family acetyltransferase